MAVPVLCLGVLGSTLDTVFRKPEAFRRFQVFSVMVELYIPGTTLVLARRLGVTWEVQENWIFALWAILRSAAGTSLLSQWIVPHTFPACLSACVA